MPSNNSSRSICCFLKNLFTGPKDLGHQLGWLGISKRSSSYIKQTHSTVRKHTTLKKFSDILWMHPGSTCYNIDCPEWTNQSDTVFPQNFIQTPMSSCPLKKFSSLGTLLQWKLTLILQLFIFYKREMTLWTVVIFNKNTSFFCLYSESPNNCNLQFFIILHYKKFKHLELCGGQKNSVGGVSNIQK